MKNYDDIINLPHYISKKHPQMSLKQRAAQFAPFATLTGYGDSIKETARLTDDKIDIDCDEKEILDRILQEIMEQINKKPFAKFTYFIPDLKKAGGKYVNVSGKIKKIDEYKQIIVLENNTIIPINEIIDIRVYKKY